MQEYKITYTARCYVDVCRGIKETNVKDRMRESYRRVGRQTERDTLRVPKAVRESLACTPFGFSEKLEHKICST